MRALELKNSEIAYKDKKIQELKVILLSNVDKIRNIKCYITEVD